MGRHGHGEGTAGWLDGMPLASLQSALRREMGRLPRGVAGRELAGDEREAHESMVWAPFREIDRRGRASPCPSPARPKSETGSADAKNA